MRTYDSKNLTDPVRDTADKIARFLYDVGNRADAYFHSHGLDRIFFHPVRLSNDAPLLHVAATQEIEEPYRASSTLIGRIPGTSTGLAFGIWSEKGYSEGEGLLRAVTDPGREPNPEDLRNFDTEATFARPDTDEPGLNPVNARLRTQVSGETFPEPGRRADVAGNDGLIGVDPSDFDTDFDEDRIEPYYEFRGRW